MFFSCGRQTKVPDGVLTVKQMTDIFWDLMLADELVAYRFPSDLPRRMDSATALYSQVVAVHKTTHGQLKSSLRFYEGRPDLLKVIFDSLNNRATAPLAPLKDSISIK